MPAPRVAETLSQQLYDYFQQYLQVETLIEERHSRTIPLLPKTPARHLPAIPGLGQMDAVGYLTGLGSAERFQTDAQVWAFAGYDPIAAGTGDQPDRVGQISKRGDRALRNTLYQMGFRVAQNYAPVGQTFLEAIERGHPLVQATIHAAHRVNRLCFHLLKHDEPFQSHSTPALEERVEQRWQRYQAAKRRFRQPRRGKRGRRRRHR